ncbi:MAG TPA: DUF4434 domain-containing protein [Bacteroidales bacterium]|nr:DUF4434 domain-containing protein [Bacteroidales bacterium]
MQRRNFLQTLGAATLGMTLSNRLAAVMPSGSKVNFIDGSWFEFQHHSAVEGKYWNPALAAFSAEQWDSKVKEIALSGMNYLVLLDIAIDGKSFYPSKLMEQHTLGCEDPLETVLSAADKYGINFFVSNGFFGNWMTPDLVMKDKQISLFTAKAMNEVAEKYGHHKSFYGWYYPNETGINGHYDDFFIDYVNESSAEAERITPNAKKLIAPYGTNQIAADDLYVKQLEKLNVDFIAYQDEVGVRKSKPEDTGKFYEQLYKQHRKAGRAKLWADLEVFSFEGDVYQSALLPAPCERVIKQLEALSPFVEKILIYEYQGMMNMPGTRAFAGHPESVKLYQGLADSKWLRMREKE